MDETGNGGGPWRRRLVALEERMHLEAGLRAAQGAQLTALGVVLADSTRRLERVDEKLDSLDAMVDNVDLHIEDLDMKVERILEILEPADG